MHIKVDDIVQVITGEDQIQGKVLKVMHADQKLVVEGVNRVYKHMRKSQKNPQGGRLSKEMPISISNVALVCPRCGKPTKTAARFLDDGSKVRTCKKCKQEIGKISPPKAAYAKKK
jgi:large subunit ribosomal protein L24